MACARHRTSLQWLDNAIPVDDIDLNNAEDCRRLVRFTEFSVENVRLHQVSNLVQASPPLSPPHAPHTPCFLNLDQDNIYLAGWA